MHAFDLVELLAERFGLTGARAGTEAADEALETLDLLLLALVLLDRLGLLEDALLAVRGVLHVVVAGLPAAELDDARRDGLEEPAVVRNHEDGAGELREFVLEPLEVLQVEVVGRLVEQQHVRVGRQRARQRRARQLAAREGRELALHVGLFEAESAQYGLDVDAPRVAADLVELGLRRRVGVHGGVGVVAARHRLFELGQAPLDRLNIAEQLGHVEPERAAVGARRTLVVQRHAPAARNADLAAIGRHLAGDDAQERRLADAVAAHEAEALARADA